MILQDQDIIKFKKHICNVIETLQEQSQVKQKLALV